MKRNFGILMALPLVFAACADDEAATTVKKSFTADYDLGLLVEYAETESAVTLTFTQLGDADPVQVDGIEPSGYTTADDSCAVFEDGQRTETRETVTTVGKNRIAGMQHVWMVQDTFTSNSAYGSVAPDENVNITGRPDAGHLFITEPNLDIYLELQGQAQCDCELDQYVEIVENDLFIFEDESDVDEQTITTVNRSAAGVTTDQTTTTIDEVGGGRNLALSTYGRYLADGYVWQTSALGNFYNGAVAFAASLVVPDGVQVGDTWLDEAGNLNAAVATETLTIDGRSISALVVVTRGSTDVAPSSDGVLGWCVQTHNGQEFAYDGTTDADTTRLRAYLTDLCDTTGGAGVDQRGTGWINQTKTWYYKGLVVRQEVSTVDVVVDEFGFAVTNDGSNFFMATAVPDAGMAINDCARYQDNGAASRNAPTTDTTALAKFQPYAIYNVTETRTVREATALREDFTLPTEYDEEGGE
jgi:hypothetical protein